MICLRTFEPQSARRGRWARILSRGAEALPRVFRSAPDTVADCEPGPSAAYLRFNIFRLFALMAVWRPPFAHRVGLLGHTHTRHLLLGPGVEPVSESRRVGAAYTDTNNNMLTWR